MRAYWKRCQGFGATFAPTSSRSVARLRLGRTVAMAGRSMPRSTPMTNIAMAIAAPVLPAEMNADAWPSRTSSAATRSEESRLRRRACDHDGGAVIAPHRVDRDLQLRAFGRDDLATLVIPAVRTHAVRQLGLAALRTHGPCGRRQFVVRAALPAAGYGVASLRQRHRRLLSVLGVSGAGASPDRGGAPGAGRMRARSMRMDRDCDWRRRRDTDRGSLPDRVASSAAPASSRSRRDD